MSWRLGGTAKCLRIFGVFSECLWKPVFICGGDWRVPVSASRGKVRAGLLYQADSLCSPEKFREKDASF